MADRREIETMGKRIAAAGEHFHRGPARGCGLFAVSLPDLGQGPRDAVLDRPRWNRQPADAEAGPDGPGGGRTEAPGRWHGVWKWAQAQTVLKAYGRARQSGDAERTASNASCEGSKVDGQAEWRGGKHRTHLARPGT